MWNYIISLYIYIYMCVCVCVFVCVVVCVSMYVYVHTYVCMYLCTCVYMWHCLYQKVNKLNMYYGQDRRRRIRYTSLLYLHRVNIMKRFATRDSWPGE